MGQKLYAETDDGGIKFVSKRKIGDVRIPNYVYDLWMPLIGATAIGVYAVYCRLERQGVVKSITMEELANACRISKTSLVRVNQVLVECGFVTITKPTGQKRLMHWTTEIHVIDPPMDISKEIIDRYRPERGYSILTPWLADDSTEPPEVLPSTSGGTTQYDDEVPPSTSEVAALGLQPLVVGETPPADGCDLPDVETQLGVLFPQADKAGVAAPDDDSAAWLNYRDAALDAYHELTGLFPDSQVGRPEIALLGGDSDFNLQRWRDSIKSCRLAGVNPRNIQCMIDTYHDGGDYQAMMRKDRERRYQDQPEEHERQEYVFTDARTGEVIT